MSTDLSAAIAGLLYRATSVLDGFMSSADKSKLDSISAISVDTASTAALAAYSTSGGPGAGFTLTFAASPATIDGVAQAAGMTVLLQHGASRTDNGVYRWATYASGGAGTLVRVPGFDTATNIPGSKVVVKKGTQRAGQTHTHRNRGAITMGTTGIFYHNDEPTPVYGRRAYDDFTGAPSGVANSSTWFGPAALAAVGTGSLAQLTPNGALPLSATPANSATVLGTVGCSTGTTAAGYGGIIDSWTLGNTAADGGGARTIVQDEGFTYEVRVGATLLSTAAQEYSIQVGFAQQRAPSQKIPADFVGFVYDRTNAISTTWRAVASTASVTTGTSTDTGVTVNAASFDTLEIHKDIGSNDILLYVNRVLMATYSTNIPAVNLGYLAVMFKNVGTTASGIYFDSFGAEWQIPQGRF